MGGFFVQYKNDYIFAAVSTLAESTATESVLIESTATESVFTESVVASELPLQAAKEAAITNAKAAILNEFFMFNFFKSDYIVLLLIQ